MNKYAENSNRYYDLTTGAYQLYFGEHFHLAAYKKGENREAAIRRTNAQFLKDGRLNLKSRVIDLGCGIGSLSLLIAKEFGCQVSGVNINKHQLEIARARAKKSGLNINFSEQDIMHQRFGKEKFDAAFFIDVEPHLPDKRKAIKNIKNLLDDNGRLVMTAWLQGENLTFAQKEFLIKPLCRLGAFPYFETFFGYKKIFTRESFKVIKFQDMTNKVRDFIDEFYHRLFRIIGTRNYKSLVSILKIIRNPVFFITLAKGNFKHLAEEAILGPIYLKICLDAGVFKLGYFVVEKR